MAGDRAAPGSLAFVDGLLDRLALRRTRSLVRGRLAIALAAAIGLAYGVSALLLGLMLELGPTGVRGTTVELLRSPHAAQWWNYPAFVVIAPQALLVLPFLATVAMVVVAAGVGLGMAAGVLLGIRVYRARRSAPAGAASSLSGLTPGLFVLLTLGACCSTSAAAVAGIGAIAQSGGTNVDALLANSWYLSVFQVAILWVALVAQEELIRIYGALTGGPAADVAIADPRPLPRRIVVGAARGFLVVAGSLWALSGLVALAHPPTGAPAGATMLGALLLHGMLGLALVGIGLFPDGVRRFAATLAGRRLGSPGRSLLLLAGGSVAFGLPPPLPGWGFGGFVNALFGAAGVSPTLGGSPEVAGASALTAVAWAAVYALLGATAIATALRPGWMLAALGGPDRARRAGEEAVRRDARAPHVEATARDEGLPA